MATSFQLRSDSDDWFSNINKDKSQHIKTDFDLYYFCLMIGLAKRKSSNPSEQTKTRDFINYFVGDYKAQQNLIIGLLLKAELNKLGVSLEDKEATKKVLLDLIDPNSPSNLTSHGLDRMNAYASGGFDYLREKIGSKPYHLEDFLQFYVQLIQDSECENNNK